MRGIFVTGGRLWGAVSVLNDCVRNGPSLTVGLHVVVQRSSLDGERVFGFAGGPGFDAGQDDFQKQNLCARGDGDGDE